MKKLPLRSDQWNSLQDAAVVFLALLLAAGALASLAGLVQSLAIELETAFIS